MGADVAGALMICVITASFFGMLGVLGVAASRASAMAARAAADVKIAEAQARKAEAEARIVASHSAPSPAADEGGASHG